MAELQGYIDALRDRARKFVSLDTPKDADLVDVAQDIGYGFLPVVGQAMAARDYERARRDKDYLGMTLSAAGMLPVVGGVPLAANMARKGGKAAEETVKALRKAPVEEVAQIAAYQGSHKPPMKGSGVPLHDLSPSSGMGYPADVYSPRGAAYYGTGDANLDKQMHRMATAYRGNPDAPVTMYRAVPSTVPANAKINHGDWVTPIKDYAVNHGEGALLGDYKIIQQQVPARKLFTNGDSWMEFGYDQTGRAALPMLGALAAGTAATAATAAALRNRKKDNEE